jgi:hypothetical protein
MYAHTKSTLHNNTLQNPILDNVVHEKNQRTTKCSDATFPSSGYRDSSPSLPLLGAHAQASTPSPPCTQQHAFFPPLLVLLL